MDGLEMALQIAVCAVISVAAVAAAFLVWRDDHKWRERRAGSDLVAEPGPYPLTRPARGRKRHDQR